MQKYDADIPEGHAFASTVNSYPNDRLLRRHGFKIHRRPKNKPAIWLFGDTPYTEEEALAQVRASMKA